MASHGRRGVARVAWQSSGGSRRAEHGPRADLPLKRARARAPLQQGLWRSRAGCCMNGAGDRCAAPYCPNAHAGEFCSICCPHWLGERPKAAHVSSGNPLRDKHRGARQLTAAQAVEGNIRVGECKGYHLRCNGSAPGKVEKLLRILSGQVGDGFYHGLTP
jgi:hypothetical protein